jgi:hypothetical protein
MVKNKNNFFNFSCNYELKSFFEFKSLALKTKNMDPNLETDGLTCLGTPKDNIINNNGESERRALMNSALGKSSASRKKLVIKKTTPPSQGSEIDPSKSRFKHSINDRMPSQSNNNQYWQDSLTGGSSQTIAQSTAQSGARVLIPGPLAKSLDWVPNNNVNQV